MMRKICIVGTGYVGLVTGACLAHLGNQVTCLDIDLEKIAQLCTGHVPFYEPGLEPLVRRQMEAGRLQFTTSYAEAVDGSQFIFVAVPTPSIVGEAGVDMRYVESAVHSVAQHLDHSAILINKSTMPVGSGDLVSAILKEHVRQPDLVVPVVANPEFLREGSAIQDFLQPDRVVLGSGQRSAVLQVAELYAPLRVPLVITDLYTAEMIKYASNAFLAAKISFINEIARICEVRGADVRQVATGMGYDKRIGRDFLDAGLGYGGSCFGKDVRALAHMAAEAGLHPQLLEAVMAINTDQRRLVVSKLEKELGDLADRHIAILGLAFKSNTDDMRDAPSIDIIRWLVRAGAHARAYDPVADETAREALPDVAVTYCADCYHAVQDCDAVVVVTDWREFRDLDLRRLRGAMRTPVLVDGRNLFDPAEMTRLGFRYCGIGRPDGGRYRTSSRDQRRMHDEEAASAWRWPAPETISAPR
jgi:UDPglucose 6-dehydrogenase